MKLRNLSNWKIVYLNKLDSNYNLIEKIELQFNDNVSDIIFNDNDKFYYLENKDGYKTETVIISNNIEEVYLKYNEPTNHYYIGLIDTYNLYADAISIDMKDEKNLFFRNDKSKKIDIIVPKDYDENKKYGLLLMFDGQNLYDKNNVGEYTDKNDPYGSWQIDVSMSMLAKNLNQEFIVVGIEHTDHLRTNELIVPSSFGPLRDQGLIEDDEKIGYIDNLDDFINETLLPYIYTNYNIDKTNIGISGSSMGGLGCHYIGLKNLGKYKFILSFTPASALIADCGWANFYNRLNFKSNQSHLSIFYFFQGRGDDLEKLLYKGNESLTSFMIDFGYNKDLIKTYIEESAVHNEVAWRYAFNYMIYDIFK